MKPTGNNILVNYPEREKIIKGIILSDSTEEELPEEGIVEAVGAEVKYVKRGDNVLFRKFGPTQVKLKEKRYLIMTEGDVLMIL